jgi:hypothetical protein
VISACIYIEYVKMWKRTIKEFKKLLFIFNNLKNTGAYLSLLAARQIRP